MTTTTSITNYEIINALTYSWKQPNRRARFHSSLCWLALCLSLIGANCYADSKPVIVYTSKEADFRCGMLEIKIEVFKDGTVSYFGTGDAVYTQGKDTAHIPRKKVRGLIKEFIDSHFLDTEVPKLEPPDPRTPLDHDRPSMRGTSLTFIYDGRERTLQGDEIKAIKPPPILSLFHAINLKRWVCFPPSHFNHDTCFCWAYD